MLDFWGFVNERHAIYCRRLEGKPWPWTDDPVLQKFYFCNIFRELDKTTVWFRENVREPMHWAIKDITMATVIFRWFNRIEVGELLIKQSAVPRYNLFQRWDSHVAKELLKGVHPVVTGAYIIKTPDGLNKLDGVCWCIDRMWEVREEITERLMACTTLEAAWKYIRSFAYQGPFMAYEVVTDLRHTCMLEKATDIMTWANPGPGAIRGLQYLSSDAGYLLTMQRLLADSAHLFEWDRKMEMRDIEHALCEYAKYRNAYAGERLKRRYRYADERA